MKSTVLHKFETADDVGAFQVTTDKVLGGNTSATFSLKPYEHFRAGACCAAGRGEEPHTMQTNGPYLRTCLADTLGGRQEV